MGNEQNISHYFIDEAGDGVLFNRKGEIIIGREGCSRFFILGFLDVPDPQGLASELEDLRTNLLANPYFKDVPSMQPEAKKTCFAFHAKDDIPEVRKEVFEFLRTKEELRFFAVVKDKRAVLHYALNKRKREQTYKYHQNELYDFVTRRLFKGHLHISTHYNICFARRGRKPRTVIFQESLRTAQGRFIHEHNIQNTATMEVNPKYPREESCLQATDYFMWALQRLYERREIRYFDFLRPSCKLVMDIDDTRRYSYGEYFSKDNPLTLETIKPLS